MKVNSPSAALAQPSKKGAAKSEVNKRLEDKFGKKFGKLKKSDKPLASENPN